MEKSPQEIPFEIGTDHGQWERLYLDLVAEMPGTVEQKQAIIRKRILRFFNSFEFKIDSYFVKRRDLQNPSNPFTNIRPIPDTLLLYGTDFISKEKINAYFSGEPLNIEIFDDSHAAIKFPSFQHLIQGWVPKIKKKSERAKMQGIIEKAQPVLTELCLWVELKPYYELCFQRKLWGRLATNEDMQVKVTSQKASYYQAYQKAREKFLEEMVISRGKPFSNNTMLPQMPRYASRTRSRDRDRSAEGSSSQYTDKHRRMDVESPSKQYYCATPMYYEVSRCSCSCSNMPILKPVMGNDNFRNNHKDSGQLRRYQDNQRRGNWDRGSLRDTVAQSDSKFRQYRRQGEKNKKGEQSTRDDKDANPRRNDVNTSRTDTNPLCKDANPARQGHHSSRDFEKILEDWDNKLDIKSNEDPTTKQFEFYLRNLHLDDSKYSAFELDE